MPAIPAIALSGMRAAQASLQASAHKIANLGTEDFRRQGVIRSELARATSVADPPQRTTRPGGAMPE